MKRTQNEENEIDLETSIYKHLKFSIEENDKVLLYHGSTS